MSTIKSSLHDLAKVDIFNGRNLPIWECRMDALLHFKGLFMLFKKRHLRSLLMMLPRKKRISMLIGNMIMNQQGICCLDLFPMIWSSNLSNWPQ